jgi:hypothetical protein
VSETTEQGPDIAPHHHETDVLTSAECRRALKVSETHWYEIAPSLPVSYALGKKSPRYIWGQILKFLERTGAAA